MDDGSSEFSLRGSHRSTFSTDFAGFVRRQTSQSRLMGGSTRGGGGGGGDMLLSSMHRAQFLSARQTHDLLNATIHKRQRASSRRKVGLGAERQNEKTDDTTAADDRNRNGGYIHDAFKETTFGMEGEQPTNEYARDLYEEEFKDSNIPNRKEEFPMFAREELRIGKTLGKGGFGTVSEVYGFRLDDASMDVISHGMIHPHPQKEENYKEDPIKQEENDHINPYDDFLCASTLHTVLSNDGEDNESQDTDSHTSIDRTTVDDDIPLHEEGSCCYSLNNDTITSESKRMMNKTSTHSKGDWGDSVHSIQLENAEQSRKFIARHCFRNGGDARYAIKECSPEIKRDPVKVIEAIADMASETRFLSVLEHPHVIKLRATALTSQFDPNYFIVMDRLYDTLARRLILWEKQLNKYRGFIKGKLFGGDRTGIKRKSLLEERLVKAYDLSTALAYLHEKKIIHRDLKPENIGFDVRGDIKVFDFGLAKEIPAKVKTAATNEDNDGLYNFTRMCGTPRYMAPEVALGKPYNESCDVYSYAILLWQMLTLRLPYNNCKSFDMIVNRVWSDGNLRPKLRKNWSPSIKMILYRSWSPRLRDRPKMHEIVRKLRQEVMVVDEEQQKLQRQQKQRKWWMSLSSSTLSATSATTATTTSNDIDLSSTGTSSRWKLIFNF